jgi:uncharacterized RDD family membrane protein YckC
MTPRYAGLVTRGMGRIADAALLALLVAGTVWVVQQFLGIDPGRCPQVHEWWNLRARVCGLMPYAVLVAGALIPPVYRVLFFTITGQTPGMAAMGLRLRRADGRAVGLRQAVKRVATFYVTLGLGSLLIPLTARRRALHDIVGGTVVVYDWGDHELDVRRAVERDERSGQPGPEALP